MVWCRRGNDCKCITKIRGWTFLEVNFWTPRLGCVSPAQMHSRGGWLTIVSRCDLIFSLEERNNARIHSEICIVPFSSRSRNSLQRAVFATKDKNSEVVWRM